MAKKKLGRPTIMTPEVIAKLEEAFAWGCTDREACLWAEIAEKTLYKYQERNPEFVQRKDALKETPVLLARKSVLFGLKSDSKLALSFLERKKKDEFSLRTETDVTTKGESINRPYEGLTKEQILEALKQKKTNAEPDAK